jgi:hypothetical protein
MNIQLLNPRIEDKANAILAGQTPPETDSMEVLCAAFALDPTIIAYRLTSNGEKVEYTPDQLAIVCSFDYQPYEARPLWT